MRARFGTKCADAHTHTHTQKKCSSWLLPVGEHYLQKVEIAISCLTASCPSKYVGELQCLSVHNPPFTVTLEETCSSSFFGAFYWGDSSSLMWLSCHHSIQTQNIFSMFLTYHSDMVAQDGFLCGRRTLSHLNINVLKHSLKESDFSLCTKVCHVSTTGFCKIYIEESAKKAFVLALF